MSASSRILRPLAAAAALAAALGAPSLVQAATWTEGQNYFLVEPPRPPQLGAGKVEVTEAFSYACPACNVFQPTMHQLQKALPANAVVDFLPASFNQAEDWPMFQLAFLTAQLLGVAERAHDAMFDAVWKTGELAVIDPVTQHIISRAPSIDDAARFYNRATGVPLDKFLAAAKSFAVDVKVRSTEETLRAYKIDRTPTLVVNGKYRLTVQSAGGDPELIELVKWLVAKETSAH